MKEDFDASHHSNRTHAGGRFGGRERGSCPVRLRGWLGGLGRFDARQQHGPRAGHDGHGRRHVYARY